MAVKCRKLILGAFIAIFSLGVCLIHHPVSATEKSDKPIHMEISPAKQKLKLERGQSFVSAFKIRNIGTEKFSYYVTAEPYTVVDENYESNYKNTSNAYSQMSGWITFDEKLKEGTLEPGASVDVPFTVSVPKDVASGGQYAAIMAKTKDGNNPSSIIQTVNSLAMILYADIAGDTRTGGSVISNNINSFVFQPPISATSTIENTGNVESTATCIMKVWPLGSNETVFNNEESQSRFIDIIPETRRFNVISWDGAPSLGIFTVEQSIEFLGQTSTVKKLVIICPLWLLLTFIIIIAILIFWLVFRIVKRRKGKSTKEDNEKERRI